MEKEEIKLLLDSGTQVGAIPICHKLKVIKQHHKLTQMEMAQNLGISRTLYGELERGEKTDPRYSLGYDIDVQLLACIYGEQPSRTYIIKQLGTLFRCVQELRGKLEDQEQVKYANMALKVTQVLASKVKGKGEI